MKDIVLKQILPKIEKLIGSYLEDRRGDATQNKYYIISQNRLIALRTDGEKEAITKLVEQANNIKNAEVLVNANDDYFSGIYGGLKNALDYIITIDYTAWFYKISLKEILNMSIAKS